MITAAAKAARREAILVSAERIFTERGYHETGIADIATDLGMGHGTFYRYFKNKHDIAEKVLERVVERFAAPAFNEDPTSADCLEEYRDQVGRILAGMVDLVRTHPTVVRFFFEQAGIVAPGRLDELIDAYADFTGMFLHNGIAKGFVRADLDVKSTSEALVALVMEGTRRSMKQDEAARARWVEAGVELMFRGIAA